MEKYILVIYPGALSTKIALFKNREQMFLLNIAHPAEELAQFVKIADQSEFRKNAIIRELNKAEIEQDKINIIVGRGGLLKPISAGVYKVNESMIHDIKNPILGEHESNIGGLIAYEIAKEIGNDSYAIIADPTCVDEMDDVARISGMPEIPRMSLLHALHQRAVAKRFAHEMHTSYEELNVIVAHMGGGVSVGAHKKGKIIDVNNGLIGDGPMSPERSGGVPSGQLVDLCFSGKYSRDEIINKLRGKGGLIAYLGTSNIFEIEKRIEKGDKKATLVFKALAYQVAKEIGALSTVLKGDINGILLTGGLSYSQMLVDEISERIQHLGLVRIYPEEDEMEALAVNGICVLNGEIEVKEYI